MREFFHHNRFKHLSWSLFSGVIGGGLTVIATGVMVRSLGYEMFGVISIWIMLQGIIQVFDYGVGAALNRELTNNQNSNDSLISGAMRFYRYNGLLLGGAVVLFLIQIYGFVGAIPYILMVVALVIQFQTLCCTAILSAVMHYDELAKSQIVSNILRFGGAIAVVSYTDSLVWFFLYQILAASISVFLFNQYCSGHANFTLRPKFFECIKSLSTLVNQSLGMWVTSIVSMCLIASDRTLVGLTGGINEVGKYSAALTAASVISLVTLPFYRVYFTEYSSVYFKDPDSLSALFCRSCKQLVLIVTMIWLVGFLGAELIFNIWLGLYDEQQIYAFKILLVGLGLASVTWLPGALCQAAGKPLIHVLAMTISLVLGVLVAVPSIHIWGYPGAAAVWLVHGLIGIVLEPYVIKRFVFPISLFDWYRKVFILPVVVIGAFFMLSFIYEKI